MYANPNFIDDRIWIHLNIAFALYRWMGATEWKKSPSPAHGVTFDGSPKHVSSSIHCPSPKCYQYESAE